MNAKKHKKKLRKTKKKVDFLALQYLAERRGKTIRVPDLEVSSFNDLYQKLKTD